MTDLEFSQDDIASLIEKVSALLPDLSSQELRLLVAIFELAAEHTEPAEAPERSVPATVEDFKQQLLDAYTPDDADGAERSLHRAGAGAASTHIIHWNPGSIHRHGTLRTGSIHQTASTEPEEG
jgi:hypothetical protein